MKPKGTRRSTTRAAGRAAVLKSVIGLKWVFDILSIFLDAMVNQKKSSFAD